MAALNLLKDFKDRERKYIFYFIMIILSGSVWVVVIIKINYIIYDNIFALWLYANKVYQRALVIKAPGWLGVTSLLVVNVRYCE